MSQQLQFSQSYRPYGSWRGGRGERLWLSTLIATMEKASQQSEPCDGATLAALRAQLALPAASYFARPFNLRN